MSAIVGLYSLQHDNIDPALGVKLMNALAAFPCDRSRTWQNNETYFGCHAQWVTPQSVAEVLPYYDPERKLAITADAIIDNRCELFEQLQVPRTDRNTIPDSLLILLAYERWGELSPQYLIGDFAFMIWDGKKNQLFGARDFSGSRTIYFTRTNQLFAFSTIITPLFSIPGVQKRPNEAWMSEFLALSIMADSVDASSTAYESIEQLAPSHSITIRSGAVRLSRYCTLTTDAKLKYKSNQEYEEAFRDVFQTAVKDRLRTNRKVGAHLSGGLDSGSVASFAARALSAQNKPLHTFSYYPVEDFQDFTGNHRFADERPYIKATVNHVGNIKDHYLSCPDSSPLSVIDDFLDTLEMPYKFFENSYWLDGIYKETSAQDIGVLLTGQRGNWSISFGPAMDYQSRLLRQFKWIRFIREFRQFSQGTHKSKVLRIVARKTFPTLSKMMTTAAAKGQAQLPLLIDPGFAQRSQVFEKLAAKGQDLWGSSAQNAFDVREDSFRQLYFWNINGTIGTKFSLKYRVWDRDPTNDLRVVRFCLALPDEQLVQGGQDRSMIRRSTAGYLPDQVRLNRKKRGIQGADGVHRMASSWRQFTGELEQMAADPIASQYLNIKQLADSLGKIKDEPRPEYVFHYDFRILMRALIFYRFMKRNF